MDDIASATGITAGALYRHYENKQALLLHVVTEDQQRLFDVLAQLAPSTARDENSIARALRIFVSASLRSRRLSLLWQREARHLPNADYLEIRARTRDVAAQFGRAFFSSDSLQADPSIVEIRSWASLSLLTSSGHNDDLGVSRAVLAGLLVDATRAIILADFPRFVVVDVSELECSIEALSRRERLIASAARIFRRSGFAGVTIDDIGAGAGVVGPALYRHFDSKADVLVAAIGRYYEWLALENSRARRTGGTPDEVLNALVDGYIRIALEATDLLAVRVTESLYLPAAAYERISRIHSDDISEWASWLRKARPQLSESLVQVLVKAARTVIDNLALIPHFRADPRLFDELRAAALAILRTSKP